MSPNTKVDGSSKSVGVLCDATSSMQEGQEKWVEVLKDDEGTESTRQSFSETTTEKEFPNAEGGSTDSQACDAFRHEHTMVEDIGRQSEAPRGSRKFALHSELSQQYFGSADEEPPATEPGAISVYRDGSFRHLIRRVSSRRIGRSSSGSSRSQSLHMGSRPMLVSRKCLERVGRQSQDRRAIMKRHKSAVVRGGQDALTAKLEAAALHMGATYNETAQEGGSRQSGRSETKGRLVIRRHSSDDVGGYRQASVSQHETDSQHMASGPLVDTERESDHSRTSLSGREHRATRRQSSFACMARDRALASKLEAAAFHMGTSTAVTTPKGSNHTRRSTSDRERNRRGSKEALELNLAVAALHMGVSPLATNRKRAEDSIEPVPTEIQAMLRKTLSSEVALKQSQAVAVQMDKRNPGQLSQRKLQGTHSVTGSLAVMSMEHRVEQKVKSRPGAYRCTKLTLADLEQQAAEKDQTTKLEAVSPITPNDNYHPGLIGVRQQSRARLQEEMESKDRARALYYGDSMLPPLRTASAKTTTSVRDEDFSMRSSARYHSRESDEEDSLWEITSDEISFEDLEMCDTNKTPARSQRRLERMPTKEVAIGIMSPEDEDDGSESMVEFFPEGETLEPLAEDGREHWQDSFASRGGCTSDAHSTAESGIILPADVVVLPSNIVAINPEDEKKEQQRRKTKLCLFVGAILGLVIVLTSVILTKTKPYPVTAPTTTMPPSAAPSKSPSESPSSSPSSENFVNLLVILRKMYQTDRSFERVFLDPSSPQYQAARWLANNDRFSLDWTNEAKLIQRFSLVTFYLAMGGDGWYSCSQEDKTCGSGTGEKSWLSANDDCGWAAVKCDGEGQVTDIFFDTRNIVGIFDTPYGLTGTLPEELGFLTHLTTLILEKNIIYGSIPEWIGLSSLQIVRLAFNQLSGTIPWDLFSQNTLLQSLQLDNNKLQGSIPWEELPGSITELQLQNNQFDGLISSGVGGLPNLRVLNVEDNFLSGTIPSEIFTLPHIEQLRFGGNADLSFELGSFVGNATTLEELSLFGSQGFHGSIPDELYNLTSLKVLHLSESGFTGTLSEDFSKLSLLQSLLVHNNTLTGTIPSAFDGMLELRDILLHHNEIVGVVSQAVCSRKGLQPSSIRNLTADCTAEEGTLLPKVICMCCKCF